MAHLLPCVLAAAGPAPTSPPNCYGPGTAMRGRGPAPASRTAGFSSMPCTGVGTGAWPGTTGWPLWPPCRPGLRDSRGNGPAWPRPAPPRPQAEKRPRPAPTVLPHPGPGPGPGPGGLRRNAGYAGTAQPPARLGLGRHRRPPRRSGHTSALSLSQLVTSESRQCPCVLEHFCKSVI